MKKHILLFLTLSVAVGFYASGLDIDESELKSTRDTAVEFINYEGPHSRIDTLEQILGIGITLGESIGGSASGYAGRYRVIHAVGDPTEEGLDADIFIVLSGAEVDHIRNMRHIIAGFLLAAYSYDLDDALILAEFVTIYNAVYRGKMDFFGDKYKQIVTRNLHAHSAGISTLYTEWAGRTEMVIPLTEDAGGGGIGSLDTDALTDDLVIEEMRTQDDLGLDSRKEMTELKEREVEEKQQEIEEERQAVDSEGERIEAERDAIDSERERIDGAREDADTEAEGVRLAQQDAALDREEATLDEQERSLAEREQDLSEREEDQAERIDQIQAEREEIVADERQLMEQEAEDDVTEVATATGARTTSRIAVFLEVRSINGESLARVVHIESGRGVIVQASTLNSIRNLRFEAMGENYVVVAGTTSGQGAVRLMTIDQESLETGREGSDDIYEGSFLLVDGGSVYAVTGVAGSWRLGRFDSSLQLRQVSELDVFEDSSMALVGESVLVVGADGAIHLLSKSDLSDSLTVQ